MGGGGKQSLLPIKGGSERFCSGSGKEGGGTKKFEG